MVAWLESVGMVLRFVNVIELMYKIITVKMGHIFLLLDDVGTITVILHVCRLCNSYYVYNK